MGRAHDLYAFAGIGAPVRVAPSKSEHPYASGRFHPVGNSVLADADYAAAGDSNVHDSAGASDGGVSFSATGIGDADRSVESDAFGVGINDVVVPDDSGTGSGGSTGCRTLSRRSDYGIGYDRPR